MEIVWVILIGIMSGMIVLSFIDIVGALEGIKEELHIGNNKRKGT